MIRKLHEMVSAVCPIEGVSIGRRGDKGTWVISFSPEATAAARQDALTVVNSFDVQSWLRSDELSKNRREAYPPMQDYLDGVVKGDNEQVQRYIEACLKVKSMYPKN